MMKIPEIRQRLKSIPSSKLTIMQKQAVNSSLSLLSDYERLEKRNTPTSVRQYDICPHCFHDFGMERVNYCPHCGHALRVDEGSVRTHMFHKGYYGSIEYDTSIDIYTGKVADIQSLLKYEGSTPEELEQNFERTIDEYLDNCKEHNIAPENPYSNKQ